MVLMKHFLNLLFLKSLIKIKPRSIVYISCNPDTQIRDVKILEKGGYKAEK